MAATLATRIQLHLTAFLENTVGIATVSAPIDRSALLTWANGVAIDQADKVYSETRTLAASGTVTLDLAGVLTDVFGTVITFARIKAIVILALAANTNNVLMGAAAATVFAGPLGSATDTIATKPGGITILIAPDAVGWAVGAGATDLLKFANSGAGTGVTYDLVLIGASA